MTRAISRSLTTMTKITGTAHLVEIAEFAAELLKISNFELLIEQATSMEDSSECQMFRDGSFRIIIENGIDYSAIIEHVAHEMVHLRQYKHDELIMFANEVIWKGKPYPYADYQTDEYFLSPWEMEARALEAWIKFRWEEQI
jgi:hypothetical protein